MFYTVFILGYGHDQRTIRFPPTARGARKKEERSDELQRCAPAPVNKRSLSFHHVMWREWAQPRRSAFIPKHSWTPAREGRAVNLNMAKSLDPIRAYGSTAPARLQLSLRPTASYCLTCDVEHRRLLILLSIPVSVCHSVPFTLLSKSLKASQSLCPSCNTETVIFTGFMAAHRCQLLCILLETLQPLS